MYHSNALALSVDDIVDDFEWIPEAIDAVGNCKVICNKQGDATMIRMRFGSSSRWMVNVSIWLDRERFEKYLDTFLEELETFFVYMGTGVCITPGSTGQTYMKLVWQNERYKKETCVSLSVEKFLRDNSVGGVIQTLQNGEYDELMKFDAASNFLAYWTVEPTGAPILFNSDRVSMYDTYFAKCDVIVTHDLPMGLFPIRGKRGRIFYPTTGGTYELCLWKEHINFLEEEGLKIRIHGGAGWQNTTSNPGTWASRIYWKRKAAPSELIEHWCKSSAVGAIGHHGMGRIHYYLAPDNREHNHSIVIVNKEGEPLCYGIVEEPDTTSAYLLHWQRHTVGMANLGSIQFGLPFAKEGRLVQIYHDSAIIVEKDERHTYIARRSNEALTQPPGTWLYELLYPCTVDKKGGVDSPQYSRHTGRKR